MKRILKLIYDSLWSAFNPFGRVVREPRRHQHVYRGRTVEDAWRDDWKVVGDGLKKAMDRAREKLRRAAHTRETSVSEPRSSDEREGKMP